MQNSGHIQAIRQCLPQNPDIPIYSVIVFFGNSEFKNVTCNANNTFIIYPRSIQQVVSEILMQPNANFGNKYEIMNLFTKAVQNGNNPMIVSSQINSAAYLLKMLVGGVPISEIIIVSHLGAKVVQEALLAPVAVKEAELLVDDSFRSLALD